MDENEDTHLSAEESISDEISERVRSVLAAAESAATAIRHEAEQQVQSKRRAAEAERTRFLEAAKAEAEALLDERMKRISELSDSLIQGAEAILMRIEGAAEVKRQLESMVHALADAAEELAAESERGRAATERPRPVAVPDPEPLKPVAAVPDVEEDEVEVVDAVEVIDEVEPEPPAEPEKPSAVQRLRQATSSKREENGAAEEAKEQEEAPAAAAADAEPQRGFDGDDMLAARLVALQMAVAGSARVEVEAHLRKTFQLDEPGAILNDVFGTESKL
jgi:hypothetical protein